jgi:hypothetical protein
MVNIIEGETMKRIINLSIALVLLLGFLAPATVTAEVTTLWEQLPGGDHGVYSMVGNWIVVDDFEFTAAATIGQVEFWSPTPGPVEVNVVFYTNTTDGSGFNIPDGVALYSDSATSPGALEDTSVCSQLYCTYRHSLVLDTPVSLDPGHYWIAVYGTGELALSYDANLTANSMAHFWTGIWHSDSRNLAFRMLEPQPSCLETIEVLNTNDAGAGSLRQALLNVCPSGTITFNASLSGATILLTSGQLLIDKDVTIDGSALATRVAINPDNMSRVFQVNSGVTATLNSLRIIHGNTAGDGGGINNEGNLSLVNVSLFNNLTGGNGGGIYNTGTLTVTNSSLVSNNASGYGGGIFNSGGTLTVSNSVFEENSTANHGGGICNTDAGTIAVANSTFSQNTAYYGGGIYNEGGAFTTVTGSTLKYNSATTEYGIGGGIQNGYAATMTVSNSTLVGNSSLNWGGGIANYGTLTLTNSTLSGNTAPPNGGGGLLNMESAARLHMANTIIAGSPSGGDCLSISGSQILTNTNNLVEDASCSASLSGDPMLGELADNGGPTHTMALLAGSPAINAGDDATCAAAPVSGLDQRGIIRPQGVHCDIGAYEKVQFTIFLPMIYR